MKIALRIIMGIFWMFPFSFPCRAQCPSMDVTGDCFVDLSDLAELASQWLTGYRLPSDMIWIHGGIFLMGNSTDAGEGTSDELPVHTVILDSFVMGKYDVTNGQYCAFLNSVNQRGKITVTDGVVYTSLESETSFRYCDTYGSNPASQINFFRGRFSVRTKGGRDMSKDPMVCVSWYGAAAYCNWRSQQEDKQPCYNLLTWNCDFTNKSYRLPTEAEWEYAARGGLFGKRFPWGMEISQVLANYFSYWSGGYPLFPYDVALISGFHPIWNDGIKPYTSPVGSFPPNGFGLYDMVGNVSNWCNDWNGSYSPSSQTNPTGPTTGTDRVCRGGAGWNGDASICRVSYRRVGGPFGQVGDPGSDGFRVVRGL